MGSAPCCNWKIVTLSLTGQVSKLIRRERFQNLAKKDDVSNRQFFKSLEFRVHYKKEDIDSSEAKAHMLTLIRALGDTKELVGFDENLTVLGRMMRALHTIIDNVTAGYGKQNDKKDIFRT